MKKKMAIVFGVIVSAVALAATGNQIIKTYIDFTQIPKASVGTPLASHDRLYFDSTDGKPYYVDHSGTKNALGGGSGGSVSTTGAIFNPSTSSPLLMDDFDSFTYAVGTPQGPLNLTLQTSGSSATIARGTPTSSEQNRFGIISFTGTGTGTAGFLTDVTPTYAGGGTINAAIALQLGSNLPSSSGNSWIGQWGLGNTWPNNADGAFFNYNYLSADFQCVTYNGATSTTTDSGVAGQANTWYNFRVISSPTQALFYINGVLVCTNTTTLPTGAYGNLFLTQTVQTGSGFANRVDWAAIQFIPNVARGGDLLTTGGSGMIQAQSGQILAPTTYTYILDQAAAFGYLINSLSAQTTAGSIVCAIQIGGVSVAGLSSVSITSLASVNTATGVNTVGAGNQVAMVCSSPSGTPANLSYTLAYTRQ